MRRGRKNDETASITIPRREKTKPIFVFAVARRMVQGRTIVIPTPTAEPLRAAMVGLRQLLIARETWPPLCHT